MLSLSFSKWVLFFAVYSFLGWLIESIWCFAGTRKAVNRGFLSGPWCPVYGFGAIIILFFSEPFKDNPILVFAAALLSTSILEYFTGWLMETLFKTKWWDYSKRKYQLKGRICLRNSLLFGLLGIALVYIFQPFASGLLLHVAPRTQRIIASLLIVVFFFDLIRSLAAAAKLEERLSRMRAVIGTMEQYQHAFSWFNKSDIAGSVERLREICASEPDNESAATILAEIDKQFEEGGSHTRLLKAFPGINPKRFSSEFETLKKGWETSHKERKIHRAQAKIRRKEKVTKAKEEFVYSYKGITVTRMVWVFLIACVIGFVVEMLFCVVTTGTIESRQGMIYGPFSQVYGFGAVLLVLSLAPLAHKGDRWLFIGGGIIGGLFEAVCSIIQESAFGSVSWEYSDQQFSFFGGRTSLQFMFFWGILSVVFMKHIYPWMSSLIDRVPARAKHFWTWIIVVVLCLDMLLSAFAVGRWADRLDNEPANNNVEVWLDEHYPNDMLEEIYPNMSFTDSGN